MNMTTRLRLFFATLLAVFGLVGLTPALAAANCTATTAKDAIQCGVNGANGGKSQSPSEATSRFNDILASIFNILTAVAGIVAVIMIITAGFRFITSAGNQERVRSARSALIYAAIGIVVVALSQILVQFVLDKSINTSNPSTGQSP